MVTVARTMPCRTPQLLPRLQARAYAWIPEGQLLRLVPIYVKNAIGRGRMGRMKKKRSERDPSRYSKSHRSSTPYLQRRFHNMRHHRLRWLVHGHCPVAHQTNRLHCRHGTVVYRLDLAITYPMAPDTYPRRYQLHR